MNWDLGLITYTENDEGGYVGLQVNVYGDGSSQTGCPAGENQSPYGFYSRPLDPEFDSEGKPDPTKSCQALYVWKGNQLYVIPTQDPRVIPGLPPLKKGESLQYGAFANFVRCMADGSVVLFSTSDATINGQSVYTKNGPSQFARIAPWGTETFDVTGYSLRHISGVRIDAGGIGGLPSPVSAFGAYYRISAPIIALDSPALALGDSRLPQTPVALSVPTAAALAAIQGEIATIATNLTAIVGLITAAAAVPGTPVTTGTLAGFFNTNLAAIASAITSASAGIAAQIALVPTKSVNAS